MPRNEQPDHRDLVDDRLLPFISRLPQKALHHFWRVLTRAKMTGNRVELEALEDYMRVAISAGGQGRKELIDAMGASLNRRMMEPDGFLDAPGEGWDEEDWDDEEGDEGGLRKKLRL